MSFLNTPSAKLHVQRLGAGLPVVMLHGLLTGSLASWFFTAAPALARMMQVVLYDLRGHGLSERVASGYDSDTMVLDLEAVTADLAAPLVLAGHSYGALIALKYALRHPDRVDRLALVELPLPPATAGEIGGFLASEPARLLDTLPPAVRASIQSGGRAATRLLKRVQFLVTQTSLLADLAAEPDLPDEYLARVACPVLLAFGSDSPCLPVGHRLAAAMPKARLRVLEGGHNLHIEASGALTDLLVDFCHG